MGPRGFKNRTIPDCFRRHASNDSVGFSIGAVAPIGFTSRTVQADEEKLCHAWQSLTSQTRASAATGRFDSINVLGDLGVTDENSSTRGGVPDVDAVISDIPTAGYGSLKTE